MYKHELPTCPGRGSPEQAAPPCKRAKRKTNKQTNHLLLISNRSLLGLWSLSTEFPGSRMWEGKGWQELEWQSCSLLSKVAAPEPLGRGRADFGRPQIWELGGKFGCTPIRPMTRLGLFCHPCLKFSPLLPDFPWRKANDPWHLDTESWASPGQEQGIHQLPN